MNPKLLALKTQLAYVRRQAAYWRGRKKKAKKGTKAYSRAATLLAQREAKVAKIRKQIIDGTWKPKPEPTPQPTEKHISEQGIEFIKEFEGFRATRYDDGVGVQTIGYGTTSADVSPLPARVTRTEADQILRRALREKYEPAIAKIPMSFTQHEYDALVSFVYNLGPGAVGGASGFNTLQRAIANKDRAAIADALLLYTNPGTSVHAGLIRRRRAERDLFLYGYR